MDDGKKMVVGNDARKPTLVGLGLGTCFLRCLFSVLRMGPIPNHISFIMDGNRRYARRRNLPVGDGHRAGFVTLMHMLRYCYELGVKFISVYALSIDNLQRSTDEVQNLMSILQEKVEGFEEKESIKNQFGVRVYFIGNFKHFSEELRVSIEKAMTATEKNSKAVLLICVAYTSTDEIVHAVEESCIEKKMEIINSRLIFDKNQVDVEVVDDKVKESIGARVNLVDVEKHMYMAVAPDPDILIRASGETRLSNFLLWQTSNCPLYSPAALWPELGLWHLVWAVANFQRNHKHLEKKKKQM